MRRLCDHLRNSKVLVSRLLTGTQHGTSIKKLEQTRYNTQDQKGKRQYVNLNLFRNEKSHKDL